MCFRIYKENPQLMGFLLYMLYNSKDGGKMTLLYFIILLSVIISLHEAGHLLAAKIFGVYCSEYAVGMGPKIFSFKGKETEYSLRLFPIGGFVAMAGDNDNILENGVTTDVPFERTLLGISKWKKIIIMLAGIFMNFVLGFLIVAVLLLHSGAYQMSPSTIIQEVSPDSPAFVAGLQSGDRIHSITIEGGTVNYPNDFKDISLSLLSYEGKGEMIIEIERKGTLLETKVSPRINEDTGQYYLGVRSNNGEVVPIHLGNFVIYALKTCLDMFKMMLFTIMQLVRGIGIKNLSGPIGIYKATETATSVGLEAYFYMMALISLNIGFMNLLPLPILDGGRVLLTFMEAFIGKAIPKRIENILMTMSTLFILFLFIFATFNDVLRLL